MSLPKILNVISLPFIFLIPWSYEEFWLWSIWCLINFEIIKLNCVARDRTTGISLQSVFAACRRPKGYSARYTILSYFFNFPSAKAIDWGGQCHKFLDIYMFRAATRPLVKYVSKYEVELNVETRVSWEIKRNKYYYREELSTIIFKSKNYV